MARRSSPALATPVRTPSRIERVEDLARRIMGARDAVVLVPRSARTGPLERGGGCHLQSRPHRHAEARNVKRVDCGLAAVKGRFVGQESTSLACPRASVVASFRRWC